MDEDLKQDYYSRTPKSIYKIGHESIRLVKWRAYCDKYYENISYYDSMTSVLSCPNEISQR